VSATRYGGTDTSPLPLRMPDTAPMDAPRGPADLGAWVRPQRGRHRVENADGPWVRKYARCGDCGPKDVDCITCNGRGFGWLKVRTWPHGGAWLTEEDDL